VEIEISDVGKKYGTGSRQVIENVNNSGKITLGECWNQKNEVVEK
jgi:hypothetical protein